MEEGCRVESEWWREGGRRGEVGAEGRSGWGKWGPEPGTLPSVVRVRARVGEGGRGGCVEREWGWVWG